MSKKSLRLLTDLLSALVALSGGLLYVADEVRAINAIPAHLANAWGLVLVLATVINRVGQAVITRFLPEPKDDPQI
jgi:hypothetical protein